MNLFKIIPSSEYFKNYISLFLIFFFVCNLLNTKSYANSYLTSNIQEENNLEDFYFDNAIKYNLYDKTESQLKMFLGLIPKILEFPFTKTH